KKLAAFIKQRQIIIFKVKAFKLRAHRFKALVIGEAVVKTFAGNDFAVINLRRIELEIVFAIAHVVSSPPRTASISLITAATDPSKSRCVVSITVTPGAGVKKSTT